MTRTLAPSESETRQALIEAGITCFAKYGYDATSIRLVASMAGKNSSLISYYFNGKEGLYREVFRYLLSHFAAKTMPESSQPPEGAPASPEEGRERLLAHVLRILRQVGAHCDPSDPMREPASRLWLSEIHAPRHEVKDLLQARIEPFVREVRACIKAIRPDLPPEEVDFWGISLHGACIHHSMMAEVTPLVWTSADRSLSLEAMGSRLAGFIYHGLLKA